MSIVERLFKYEETKLSVIKRKDDIWFRGKTIVEILGCLNPLKAICKHFDSEDKSEISELELKSRGAQNGHPFKNRQRGPGGALQLHLYRGVWPQDQKIDPSID